MEDSLRRRFEKLKGEEFVVKCKCKDHDFIPCIPSPTSALKITEIVDGKKLIFCGIKEIGEQQLFAFYVLNYGHRWEKEPDAIFLGEEMMLEYLCPTPKMRKARKTRFA